MCGAQVGLDYRPGQGGAGKACLHRDSSGWECSYFNEHQLQGHLGLAAGLSREERKGWQGLAPPHTLMWERWAKHLLTHTEARGVIPEVHLGRAQSRWPSPLLPFPLLQSGLHFPKVPGGRLPPFPTHSGHQMPGWTEGPRPQDRSSSPLPTGWLVPGFGG